MSGLNMPATSRAVSFSTAMVAFAITAFLLPGLAYLSAASHGVHGAAFLLLIYGSWIVLRRSTSFGDPFLMGSSAAAAAVLIPMLFLSPRASLMMIIPVTIAEAIRRAWGMYRSG